MDPRLAVEGLMAMKEELLKKLGWVFVPTGPEEWEWIKFDKGGEPIGRQGSEHWKQDLEKVDEGLRTTP